MNNKNMIEMDIQKIGENKKIMKQLDADQVIAMSAKVIKINHVNKRQERVLVVTNRNIYNIASPTSIFPNRIKRKISLLKISALTASRYGNQIVIHVENEDDYRLATHNLRNKFIEAIVEVIGKSLGKPVKIYFYDDLALDQYTTTIIDIEKKRRKQHKCEPTIVDYESVQKKNFDKPESKLIFKAQNSEKAEAFEEFEIVKVLGRGAFGKVMLCKHESGIYYAVKSMRKENLIERDSLERTKTQRYLLQKVSHPFLVNLEYAFQTKEKVFLVMHFYRGGEMFSKIRKQKRFGEQRARFYAAQVFLALQYLHNMGYIYRDLKPENILFDVNGYIKVSDYGLSKKLNPEEKAFSITGTPSYLSPQVLLRQGHTFSVDWWSLGVLIYEMIFSCPPFYQKDQKMMFQQIINRELEFPKGVTTTPECRSLLRGLLSKYPEKRLGHRSSDQIKSHPWFSEFDWEKLYRKELVPSYIPELSSLEDVSNFHESFTNEEPVNTIIDVDHQLLDKFETEFANFDFHRPSLSEEKEKGKRISVNPQAASSEFEKLLSSPSAPSFKKK